MHSHCNFCCNTDRVWRSNRQHPARETGTEWEGLNMTHKGHWGSGKVTVDPHLSKINFRGMSVQGLLTGETTCSIGTGPARMCGHASSTLI